MSDRIRSRIRIVTPIVLLLAIPVAAESVLFVDAKASAGGNGSSWSTAHRYLQDALTAAAPGSGVTEVRVAAGTYKPDQGQGFTPGDRDAAFNLVDGVAIRGGYAGLGNPDPSARDMKVNETILSGDLLGNDAAGYPAYVENSRLVVRAFQVGRSSILQGFTVTGGHGDSTSDAGGICVGQATSPVLANLIVRQNYSDRSDGGGIKINNSSAAVASPLIVNCLIAANSSEGTGGGAFVQGNATPTFINCLFVKNLAGNWVGGGVAAVESAKVNLVNCTFIANIIISGGRGGAVGVMGSEIAIRNCTIVDNFAGGGGGGIYVKQDAKAEIQNCILWDNTGSSYTSEENQILSYSPQVQINSCTIQGWTGLLGGTNNNGIDPLFAYREGLDGVAGTLDDNLRLRTNSPCVDTGNNDCLPADEADLDGDGDRTEQLPLDLDGAPRLVGGTVDRGAYEATDCNANGISDVADIVAGTSTDCNNDLIPDECQPQLCPCRAPGDFDCDGDVDQSDFGMFQACLSGATVPQTDQTCEYAHIDTDNDVDAADLRLFVGCISGPGKPAQRDCAG